MTDIGKADESQTGTGSQTGTEGKAGTESRPGTEGKSGTEGRTGTHGKTGAADQAGTESRADVERALREALRAQGESYTVSPDAWERVRERADRRGYRGRGRRRLAGPVLAASAVACTAVAITLVPSHLPGGGSDREHRAGPLAQGSGSQPPPSAILTPREVAKTLATLCAGATPPQGRALALRQVGALRDPGDPGRWFVPMEEASGNIQIQALSKAGRRTICRAYTRVAPRGWNSFVGYSGERGAGEASWVGFAKAPVASFEAVYTDGTRMRFACGARGQGGANCGRATVGRRGAVTIFATAPRMYRPRREGERITGVLTLLNSEGKVVGRHPFAR
ncbi:hypothetical protein [Actinomadura terrae]|uniref:hypothetical protein n=1 Tax=Actinomadura terrae TaxID=604353 RepID=UPI001FA6E565|nr:hypothetical protein [Actinomadura terrae]